MSLFRTKMKFTNNAKSFRIQLSKKMVENDCLTPEMETAMSSTVDGELAKTIGEYGMEPFIKHMSSCEFLEIFAPNLLYYFQLNSMNVPIFTTLDELFLDIEMYLNY